MPLRVVCRAQYLSESVPEMRDSDYKATHLVKAVKGLELNPKSYAWVTIAGVNTKITEETKDKAIEWFARWAAQRVDSSSNGPKVLVPIPSSKTIKSSSDTFRTAAIAREIAANCKTDVVAAPLLRWTQVMLSSREGGPRDPKILYPRLTLLGALPEGRCVLIDDVFTSGGHLIASAWKLEDVGREVELAI